MLDPRIPRLNIRLNGDGVVAHMQNAAKRVAQAISVLLPAVDRHDFSQNAELGPVISRYGFQAWADVEQDRAHFEAWLVSSMLHELSRGVRSSLEEAHLYLRLFHLEAERPHPVTIIDDIRREAATANTPKLLQWVNEGLKTELGFGAEMDALNRARNCLEHARGLVRERDCDPGEPVMRLAMPYFALCRLGADGEVIDIEVGVPLPADGPHQIVMQRRAHVFEFAVNTPLLLTRDQIEAAVIGCTLFAIDLAGRLPTRQAPEDPGLVPDQAVPNQ